MILLSILIPTLPDRIEFFRELRDFIITTTPAEYLENIEIVSDNRGRHITTGEKRNDLLNKAKGKYIWPLDDDDALYPYSIAKVYEACLKDPDVVGINGIMTTDGKNEQGWEIRLGHPYKAEIRNGKEYYLRFPNHITPMKTELAKKIKFPHLTVFEDFKWAEQLNNSGILKTQVIIEDPVYHYRVRSKK